ncbi:unnamed protein product [Chrysoparadoxa australica]
MMASSPQGGTPSGVAPLFKGLVISSTGLTGETKAAVRNAVEAHGGRYAPALTDEATHLVAETTDSEKYKYAAAEDGKLCVVRMAWVMDSCSKGQLMPADQYQIPCFQGLTISVTGIGLRRRQVLGQMITENGGTYSGILEHGITTHLVAEEPKGDKYAAASGWGQLCHVVHSNWVLACIKKGLRLAEDAYRLVPGQCEPEPELLQSLDLDLSKLPDSGALSSCCVLLVGFGPRDLKTLSAVLRKAGATRYTFPNDAITHVVVGQVGPASHKLLSCMESHSCKPAQVIADWVIESCKACRLLPVHGFRRAKVKSMAHTASLTSTASVLSDAVSKNTAAPDAPVDKAFGLRGGPAKVSMASAAGCFSGLLFVLQGSGLTPEAMAKAMRHVVQHGGHLLETGAMKDLTKAKAAAKAARSSCGNGNEPGPHCFLVSAHGSSSCESGYVAGMAEEVAAYLEHRMGVQVVSDTWLSCCAASSTLYDLDAESCPKAFRPLPVPLVPLLSTSKVVVALSNFPRPERAALGTLLEQIGAIWSHQKFTPSCTHLVCKAPMGPMYQTANSLKKPVVTSEWVYACASGGYVPGGEGKYLLDGSNNRNDHHPAPALPAQEAPQKQQAQETALEADAKAEGQAGAKASMVKALAEGKVQALLDQSHPNEAHVNWLDNGDEGELKQHQVQPQGHSVDATAVVPLQGNAAAPFSEEEFIPTSTQGDVLGGQLENTLEMMISGGSTRQQQHRRQIQRLHILKHVKQAKSLPGPSTSGASSLSASASATGGSADGAQAKSGVRKISRAELESHSGGVRQGKRTRGHGPYTGNQWRDKGELLEEGEQPPPPQQHLRHLRSPVLESQVNVSSEMPQKASYF